MVTVAIPEPLIKPIREYQEKRRYETFAQAARTLIRIGLEQENEKI
jgi:Arc/MetJ-type ribon-helix-helix transcriptional regulator